MEPSSILIGVLCWELFVNQLGLGGFILEALVNMRCVRACLKHTSIELYLKLHSTSKLNKSTPISTVPKNILPPNLNNRLLSTDLPHFLPIHFPPSSSQKIKNHQRPHFSPTSPSRFPTSFPNLVVPFRLPLNGLPTPLRAGTT